MYFVRYFLTDGFIDINDVTHSNSLSQTIDSVQLITKLNSVAVFIELYNYSKQSTVFSLILVCFPAEYSIWQGKSELKSRRGKCKTFPLGDRGERGTLDVWVRWTTLNIFAMPQAILPWLILQIPFLEGGGSRGGVGESGAHWTCGYVGPPLISLLCNKQFCHD